MPYIWPFMSVNAKLAYDNGFKPWNDWHGKKLCSTIYRDNPQLDIRTLTAQKEEVLRRIFLVPRGWHHMGPQYKRVRFFGIQKLDCTEEEFLRRAKRIERRIEKGTKVKSKDKEIRIER